MKISTFNNIIHYLRMYRFNSIYARTVIVISFTFILIIVAMGIVSYNNAANSVQKKVNEAEVQKLVQIQKNIDSIFEEVEANLLNLSSQFLLKQDFDDLELSKKIESSTILFEQVKLDPYIHSLYVYYYKSKKVVASNFGVINIEWFNDKEWLNIFKDEYQQDLQRYVVKDRRIKNNAENLDVMTFMIEFPLISMPKHGILVSNIDKQKLFQSIGQPVQGDTISMVLGQNGELLYGDEGYFNILNGYKGFEEIHNGNISFRKIELNNKEYMLSSTYSPKNGWVYLKLQDTKFLSSDANSIKQFTINLVLIVLLIGLTIWIIEFSRLINPIVKLLNRSIISAKLSGNEETKKAKNELDLLSLIIKLIIDGKESIEKLYFDSYSDIKKGLLLNFCNGDIFNKTFIEKQLEVVGFPSKDFYFNVMLVSIDNFKKIKISESGERLIFIKENIKDIIDLEMREKFFLLSAYVKNEMLMCITAHKENENSVIRIATQIQKRINEELRIEICIGIGGSYNDIFGMHLSYNEAMDALRLNVLVEKGTIMHINSFDVLGNISKYYYPLSKEEELINATKMGDKEKAIQLVDEVYFGMPKNLEYATNITEMLWQIMNGLFRGINSMGVKYEDIFGKGFFEEYLEYRQLEKVEDMLMFIKSQITSIIDYISKNRNMKNSTIIESIKKYINENLKETISLTDVASRVYMSPSYISALFKENTGLSFTDYLIRARMEKAEELLQNTSKDINVISCEVGYETRNFLRMFKKFRGITPTEFRKNVAINDFNNY